MLTLAFAHTARDFPGGDSASKQVLPDLATCVQACQTMGKDKCAGVSWVPEEGECYFKQELNTPVYNEGVIGEFDACVGSLRGVEADFGG